MNEGMREQGFQEALKASLTRAYPLSPMSAEIKSSCQLPGHSCLYHNRATLHNFPFPSPTEFHHSLCAEQDNLTREWEAHSSPLLSTQKTL